MHKNKKTSFCMIAALLCAFGMSMTSVHAADTDLDISQKIERIIGKESQQQYIFNYTGEDADALKIEYDKGFYAKELKVGDWDNYSGKIKISAYSKTSTSPVMTTETDENTEVSLENYSNIDWIQINPVDDTQENASINEVDLSGTIYADKSGKSIQVKGSIWNDGTYTGTAKCEKTVATVANDYAVGTPYVQVNPDQVNYLGSTAMTIKNMQGSLKAGQLNSYHVIFHIPERMFVDSITLPKFDNATYKLYVNGNQMDTRNNKIYVNDKAADISMDITPTGDFFSQSQDMLIEMRNTINQTGDNKVSVSASAVCGNGCTFSAESNAVPIKYQEQTVVPSEPEEPDTPSTPEEPAQPDVPSLPDSTGTENKKNDQKSNVKKNNTVTSIDLIREDTDDTDEKKDTVVDLSGVNLQSAKATKNSINTFANPNAEKKSTYLAGLNSERIQTTDIQDFENDSEDSGSKDIKDQIASADDGITGGSSGKHESATQKAKNTVSENRGVQLGIIIGIIVIAGIAVIVILTKKIGKAEEIPEEIEQKVNPEDIPEKTKENVEETDTSPPDKDNPDKEEKADLDDIIY